MTSETLPIEAGALGGTAPPPSSPWARLAVAFFGSVLGGAVLLVALIAGIELAYADRALPGVNVGGVDLGGLTREAAVARLDATLPPLDQGTLTLALGGEELQLDYAALGREYDTDTMLERAFAAGRDPDPLVRGVEELRMLVRGAQLAPTVRWNEPAVASALRSAARGFDRVAVDAVVERDDAGRFVVSPSVDGRRIDQAAMAAQIRALLDTPDAPAQATISLAVEPVAPAVRTADATYALYRANLISSVDLNLIEGRDKWQIAAADVRSWIHFEPSAGGGLRVEVVGPELEATLKQLAREVARKPRDARFLVGKSGKIEGVVAGVTGRKLDIPNSMPAIAAGLNALEEDSPPATVELAVTITQPKLTTEEASKVAPLMTRLGTWTTYYPPGEGNFYGKNISVPARIVSGTVVPAGSWFSFWDATGVPTPEQGYGPGGVIVNGRSDPTGAFAGGICSTSTTLFNAALRAGLEMGTRNNHYYYIPRYPLGLDATVWMYTWTSRGDMTFRNDTASPILILSFNSYGVVRFDIYGVRDGRKTTLSEPIIKNVVKAKDTIVYTTEIPAGTTKRVEFPHDGMDAWVTRTVTRNGQIIHRETYYSDYKRVDGILWIGVAPESEPAPEPTPAASLGAMVWA